MNRNCKYMGKAPVLFLIGTLLLSGCAGGSLTTREKGAGIGALGGAAAVVSLVLPLVARV